MNVEDIKNALDLAQCEIRSFYKRSGINGSNILDKIDKCLADLSNPINNELNKAPVSSCTEVQKCMENNCKENATKDYNGCGHWVCQRHYDKLSNCFDDDYS